MKKLTKKEEEIMQEIWRQGKAFIKDIVDALPAPKPHYNTVSTVLKILKEKKFVDNVKYGNVFQYFPLVSKDAYKTGAVDDLLEKYFDSSYVNMIAHFAKKEDMNQKDIDEIISLIKSKKS